MERTFASLLRALGNLYEKCIKARPMKATTQRIFELDQKYHAPLYRRLKICLVKGKGTHVWDSEGKEYLDCVAGIAVNNVGHCHPKVVQAIREQAEKLMHCSNLYYIQPQAMLAEKLIGMLPKEIQKVFFCNSGTEAVEAALKLARRASGKPGIIAMEGSFHGRTFGSLSVTGQEKYRRSFEPLLPGVKFAKFGDISSLKNAVDESTGTVILEPIQGEGGIVVPPEGYLQAVREFCDEKGLVLIFDEIQTGMGRTGAFLASERIGVVPDIVCLAKGIGGGFPMGAMAAKSDIMNSFQPGDHASTFGGNPLACAAGLAALEVLEEERLPERARETGKWALDQMKRIMQEHPSKVVEVRGLGLMLGLQLDDQQLAIRVFERCLEEGVLVNRTAGTVIRLVPPLSISKDELSQAFSAIELGLSSAK